MRIVFHACYGLGRPFIIQVHPQNFPRSLFCSVFLTHQLALLGEIVPIEEALKLFHPVLQHILWHLRNNKSVIFIDMLE